MIRKYKNLEVYIHKINIEKVFEKLELSERLKETSDKFHPSILNIKKVVLLKQQLEK